MDMSFFLRPPFNATPGPNTAVAAAAARLQREAAGLPGYSATPAPETVIASPVSTTSAPTAQPTESDPRPMEPSMPTAPVAIGRRARGAARGGESFSPRGGIGRGGVARGQMRDLPPTLGRGRGTHPRRGFRGSLGRGRGASEESPSAASVTPRPVTAPTLDVATRMGGLGLSEQRGTGGEQPRGEARETAQDGHAEVDVDADDDGIAVDNGKAVGAENPVHAPEPNKDADTGSTDDSSADGEGSDVEDTPDEEPAQKRQRTTRQSFTTPRATASPPPTTPKMPGTSSDDGGLTLDGDHINGLPACELCSQRRLQCITLGPMRRLRRFVPAEKACEACKKLKKRCIRPDGPWASVIWGDDEDDDNAGDDDEKEGGEGDPMDVDGATEEGAPLEKAVSDDDTPARPTREVSSSSTSTNLKRTRRRGGTAVSGSRKGGKQTLDGVVRVTTASHIEPSGLIVWSLSGKSPLHVWPLQTQIVNGVVRPPTGSERSATSLAEELDSIRTRLHDITVAQSQADGEVAALKKAVSSVTTFDNRLTRMEQNLKQQGESLTALKSSLATVEAAGARDDLVLAECKAAVQAFGESRAGLETEMGTLRKTFTARLDQLEAWAQGDLVDDYTEEYPDDGGPSFTDLNNT